MPEEFGPLHSARFMGNVLFFVCVALISLSLADPEVRPIDMAVRQLTAMKAAPLERCAEKFRQQQGFLPKYDRRRSESKRLPSVFLIEPPRTIEDFNAAFHGGISVAAVQITIPEASYEQARMGIPLREFNDISLFCGLEDSPGRKFAYLEDGTLVVFDSLRVSDLRSEVFADCSVSISFGTGSSGSYLNVPVPLRERMVGTIEWGGALSSECAATLEIPYFDDSHWLAFKALLPYWPEIYSMTPDEAIRYLRDRHEAEHRPVSLLGVTFESPLAFTLAHPALIFCLLIFSIHLKQLQRQLEDGKKIEYPSAWVALYPGREALGLVFFAILLLPIAASISLAVRLEAPLRPPLSLINAAFSLACVGLSWRSTKALLKIRALVLIKKDSPIVTS